MSFAVSYPQQATLFSQDDPCRGVFILCSGKAKISARSLDGKQLLVRMVDAGESLGLSATITGAPYDVTAITTAPSVVRFVKREDFLLFLRSFPESGLNAVHALSLEYQGAFDSLRSIALSHNATSRIAQLLLRMAANGSPESAGNIRLLLTQEQIAQMTCTTRETVTRFFTQLRREHVITIRGSNLLIMDRLALEKMAS